MLRRATIFALIVVLAACGRTDPHAPVTESHIPADLGQGDWPPPGWAWGLIQIGRDPPQRYGVAAAANMPRAQVLILTGYGDLAEAQFAAASDFAAHDYVVWVLEGEGQGGSGRIALPRDLGYVRSFDGDVGAVLQMVQSVIRPARGVPVTVIAEGSAAPVALRAAQEGLPGVSSLILSDPRFLPPGPLQNPAHVQLMVRLGLGGWRAAGERRWLPDGSSANPVLRDWQIANPDLRMGGPSYAWIAAFDDLVARMSAADWSPVTVPVLVLQTQRPDQPSAQHLCRSIAHCRFEAIPDAHAAQVQAIEATIGDVSFHSAP